MPDATQAARAAESPRLDGRTAVVTGASRGIGLAAARALTDAGARVVLVARGERALREMTAALGTLAMAVRCDVASAGEVELATRRIADALDGPPHILVNNAGAFVLATVESTEPETFIRTLDTNLVAPFLFARAFLPAMRARRDGHIITVGSVADRAVLPENGAYAASKYGARALHEVMRAELRGSGVRATLVSPGPVDTPLWDPVDPDVREGFTPRARMLTPDAVADAILYVATRPAAVNVDELRLSRS